MVKILVCGYGSIGKKHAVNLKALQADIRIWRFRAEFGQKVEDDGFVFEPSVDEGLGWCDGVVIATSTNAHIPLAMRAAKLRKAIYMEKPVSNSYDGVSELVRMAFGLVVEVGCQMRKHPDLEILHKRMKSGEAGKVLAFQAWVGQRLDQWRPGTDYRKSYSADVRCGGGALFDLVHEIDLMTWLVGPVQSVYADLRHNSDLEMNAEDLANLILVSENGAAGTMQLDMLSPAYRRGMQIVCEKCVYKWEMKEGGLWCYKNGEEPVCISKTMDDDIHMKMLFGTMEHFLKRIEDDSIPALCSLEEGVHDLDILLAARKASESGQKQNLVNFSGEGR